MEYLGSNGLHRLGPCHDCLSGSCLFLVNDKTGICSLVDMYVPCSICKYMLQQGKSLILRKLVAGHSPIKNCTMECILHVLDLAVVHA